ncbi:MAG TPA: IPTL-CTERM sorting domain-containing protein [Thermodesulfobacteriota bacterium]|nr:IPTL-CTERM sorting domain-containing protein [Thermodesulfobacteriota bacterium]
MKKILSAFSAVFLLLVVLVPVHRAEAVCVRANGLDWCYNDQACGEACNEVCAALGLQVIEDDQVWFEAQNSAAECQAISEALGLGGSISFFPGRYDCLEDEPGNHTVGGGLLGQLYCSSADSCPLNHRTGMDQQGDPCGPSSRRSICPCEALPDQIIDLTPESSSGPAGSEQTVTASVTEEGSPVEGALVTFRVVSGPSEGKRSGVYGICSPNPDCTTGPDGLLSWTYSSFAVGTDTVTASFEGSEGEVISSPVEVIWTVLPIPALSEWGLIAAASLMGVAGYIVVRRRKAAA